MSQTIQEIFGKEDSSIKFLTDYVINALSTKKEEREDVYEVAKDFILKAIKPRNRQRYLNNWTNDILNINQVFDAEDFQSVLMKIEKQSRTLTGSQLHLRNFETLSLRFRCELKFKKPFYEILKELHLLRKLTVREMSDYFLKEFHIYVSFASINIWLKKLNIQKLHHIQMHERYISHKIEQKRGIKRPVKAKVVKKLWNRKRLIYILLDDKNYERYNNLRALSDRTGSSLINHIYSLSRLNPKIDYSKTGGLTRTQIVINGMNDFWQALLRGRIRVKKEYTFSIARKSYQAARDRKSRR